MARLGPSRSSGEGQGNPLVDGGSRGDRQPPPFGTGRFGPNGRVLGTSRPPEPKAPRGHQARSLDVASEPGPDPLGRFRGTGPSRPPGPFPPSPYGNVDPAISGVARRYDPMDVRRRPIATTGTILGLRRSVIAHPISAEGCRSHRPRTAVAGDYGRRPSWLRSCPGRGSSDDRGGNHRVRRAFAYTVVPHRRSSHADRRRNRHGKDHAHAPAPGAGGPDLRGHPLVRPPGGLVGEGPRSPSPRSRTSAHMVETGSAYSGD